MTTLANRGTTKREPPQTQTQRRARRPRTRRVRIALLMAPDGRWDVRGWGHKEGPEEDAVLLDALRRGALGDEPGALVQWIEANARVPEPVEAPGVIEGTVTEANRG